MTFTDWFKYTTYIREMVMITWSIFFNEMIEKINNTVSNFSEIYYVDNIVLHDYGPSNKILNMNVHFRNEHLLSEATEIINYSAKEIMTATGCQVQMIL